MQFSNIFVDFAANYSNGKLNNNFTPLLYFVQRSQTS